jgi:hypothetical protein
MRVKTYVRVGFDKRTRQSKVETNPKPNYRPLTRGNAPLPTVAFAIWLDVPDGMFAQAEQVIATLTIPESAVKIAAEVVEP